MSKIPIVIILALALSVGLFFYNNRNNVSDTEALGTKILNTTSFVDYAGDSYVLNQNDSKLIVVNSWASWCPFCKRELTDFIRATSKYSPKDVTVIAINRGESLDISKSFSENLNANKLVFLLDLGDKFYKEIGGFSMPETLFMDKKLNVLEHKHGAMTEDEIKEKVAKYLGEL